MRGMAQLAATSFSAGSTPQRHSTGTQGEFSQQGGAAVRAAAERQPPVSTPPSLALLEAVGSGVISVSRAGAASIEHLGRGPSGSEQDGSGSPGFGSNEEQKQGQAQALSAGEPMPRGSAPGISRDSPQASASLWRMRAARRRRQARGEKMRSLTTWATGQDPVGVGTLGMGDVGRGGATTGSDALGPRGSKASGRPVAMGSGVSGARRGGSDSGAAGIASGVERGQPDGEQGQSVGWGVKLQARALAIPASFLPKRT